MQNIPYACIVLYTYKIYNDLCRTFIYNRIAKRIAASDQFDLNLNGNLYVIYSQRTSPSNSLMALQTHSGSGVRYIPGVEVNPATDMSGTVRIVNSMVSVTNTI